MTSCGIQKTREPTIWCDYVGVLLPDGIFIQIRTTCWIVKTWATREWTGFQICNLSQWEDQMCARDMNLALIEFAVDRKYYYNDVVSDFVEVEAGLDVCVRVGEISSRSSRDTWDQLTLWWTNERWWQMTTDRINGIKRRKRHLAFCLKAIKRGDDRKMH